MTAPRIDAVVAGAGIAGLAAAVELQAGGCEVIVIDPSDRPGGVMRTEHAAGYVLERGPNSFLVKAPMRGFLERRGLADSLLRAGPESRRRMIYRDGRPLPIPASPWGLARSPHLGGAGLLRLALEPFVRRGEPESESVAEFARRRLGGRVVTGLLGPFLTGVYAGDEEQLGAEAVLPGLVELERRAGSIALGGALSLFRRGGPKGLRGSYSVQEGLGPFARRLADQLAEPPALGSRVASLSPDGDRWRVELSGASGNTELSAARVVVAAPSFDAATILRSVDGGIADALEGIAYAPIVSIALGVDPQRSREPIEGFGFLVPREAEMGLLGCLYMSRLFPGRAPEGRELLQCILGGVRWPEAVHEPDDVLLERLGRDLEGALGIPEIPGPLALTRWEHAVPQPARDHRARIDWIEDRLSGHPGLALAGSYLNGVGIPDALASGLAAAEAVGAR